MPLTDVTYRLTGTNSLLLHADRIEEADRVLYWRKNHPQAKSSPKGDDRYPAWTWQTYLHDDGKQVVIPWAMIYKTLMNRASSITLPTGHVLKKGATTYKKLIPSVVVPRTIDFPLLVGEKLKPVMLNDLPPEDMDFKDQADVVKKLGFHLSMKRASVDNKKHVRVRPEFRQWSVDVPLRLANIDPKEGMPVGQLTSFLTEAGLYSGIGDWRPSAPKSPGWHGTFDVAVT